MPATAISTNFATPPLMALAVSSRRLLSPSPSSSLPRTPLTGCLTQLGAADLQDAAIPEHSRNKHASAMGLGTSIGRNDHENRRTRRVHGYVRPAAAGNLGARLRPGRLQGPGRAVAVRSGRSNR